MLPPPSSAEVQKRSGAAVVGRGAAGMVLGQCSLRFGLYFEWTLGLSWPLQDRTQSVMHLRVSSRLLKDEWSPARLYRNALPPSALRGRRGRECRDPARSVRAERGQNRGPRKVVWSL